MKKEEQIVRFVEFLENWGIKTEADVVREAYLDMCVWEAVEGKKMLYDTFAERLEVRLAE